MKKLLRLNLSLLAGLILHQASSPTARAGSFSADFNSGLPAGTAVFGNSTVFATGGLTNSGCLQLTTNALNMNGGFVITNDLDAGQPVVSFVARFKALIGGGTGADGFSFSFAPDLPLSTMTEDGAGSGLSVEFDTYANPGGDDIGIDLHIGGGLAYTFPFGGLRQNTFVDVYVALNPDRTLNVIYDGVQVYTNTDVSFLNGGSPIIGGLFGFGSRTGGSSDNHLIDNLTIVTQTNALAFLDTFAPNGRSARANAAVNVVLTDSGTQVDTNSIVLNLDGTNVTPVITQVPNAQSANNTVINYLPPQIFASGSSHSVTVTFVDNAAPTPNTNKFQYSFTVSPYSILSTNLIAPTALVSTNPGFLIHVSQIAANLGPTVQRAEKQLANLLFDPATSQPYANLANPNSLDGTYTFIEPNVINYSTQGGLGDFPTESGNSIPGLPGINSTDTNSALDVATYIYLTPGLYTFGVNSSDGYALTAATTPDVFAPVESTFPTVRAAADTLVTFGIVKAGYYPFRICYFIGGQEAVTPTADVPGLEFFSIDVNGVQSLINDVNAPGYVAAFQPAQTVPYIQSLNPSPDQTSVPHGTAIDATLVNGSITVQTNTIQLQLNGTVVTPLITANAGVITVHYQPPTPLTLNSTNTVQLAFTDTTASRRTNSYTFVVENTLTQLWLISPTQTTNATWQKWVTAGSSERGIAYNPKTGHVLIVSRNTATGTDAPGGLGIGVFNGDTGAYLSKLNLGSGIVSGGTFALNLVRVADDGVIYACNLSTSGAQNFNVYRWQNESASPTIAYSAAPTASAGTPRWGDDFAVRRSGSGTQFLASGNNASVNTVELFTTTNGSNYDLTILTPTGLPNNIVRLGLAFGCGNTFYGETTGGGNPLRYVSFTGAPSTAGVLSASYTILDSGSAQAIGPIGVDLANQRLIGDATSGGTAPHSMNLYDLNTLAVTPANNLPIDHKAFGTSVGSFGTGAVDFTPDGTRVYTLDTGNGVIAFSLAPKPAAPSICSQPQNSFLNLGSLAFFGVDAIGSTMAYQWRINNTNIPGATNRTIDLPNIQATNLGRYTVVITNSLGSITSSIALLDLPLLITNQPSDQLTPVGGLVTFTVGASGNAPFTYQWQHNGTNVLGATLATLTVTNAQEKDAGGYAAVVTDPIGQAVTSLTAGLTVGVLGSGTGLNGDYYTSQAKTFAGLPTFSQLDPTINFDYGAGSPNGALSPDTFTIRWAGTVLPLYSQTYTFYVKSDDGARLWVNGQKIIDKWVAQSAVENSGTIALQANQPASILLEYFENTGNASVILSWSSPGQVKQVIPQSQLFPTSASPSVPSLSATTPMSNGTNFIINWPGSYTLQSSTNASGPYVDLTGVTSPYTNITTSSSQQFFRLKSE